MSDKNKSCFSKAYQEFLENRKSILYLVKATPSESEQLKSGQKRKLANATFFSCVLLLSSYIERYIESLVVEMIDFLNSANLEVKDIPEPLRISQIKEQLEKLNNSLNKQRVKKNISQTLAITEQISTSYKWFLNDNDVFSQLSGEPLIGENRFSNPSPEKIDELFHLIGINDIVGQAIGLENKPDRVALRDKTKELIEKRNNIAHTGGTVTVAKQDISEYLLYSRRLLRNIDFLVGQEISKTTKKGWPWI